MQEIIEKAIVPADENTYNLILAMKKARVENKMTLQRIADKCEEAGYAMSLTTVKRVFVEGSEYKRFNYNSTLRPIARVMGNLDEDVPVSAKENTPAVNDLLRAVIGIKEDTIIDMKQGIQERETELARIREETARRLVEKETSIEHLKEELTERKQDIAQMRTEIQQLKKGRTIRTIAIIALSALLLLCMATAVVYLAAK